MNNEIIQLEQELAELVSEVELLIQKHRLEWNIDHAKRQKFWLKHGVRIPLTPLQVEQDQIYSEMDRKRQAELAEREEKRLDEDRRALELSQAVEQMQSVRKLLQEDFE